MSTTITRSAPPVGERPACPGCSKPLRPRMRHFYENGEVVRKEWTGNYNCYGAFCTLKCCARYANAMFEEHGTRFRVTEVSWGDLIAPPESAE